MGRNIFRLFLYVVQSCDTVRTTEEMVKGRQAVVYAYICRFAVWVFEWCPGVQVVVVSLRLRVSRA